MNHSYTVADIYNQAKGEETRDAVLLSATRAIFDARDSGYITKGRSEAPNPMEVINRFLGGRGPKPD